jgi:pimeloyl-ACP methyl ester carboxylesterase
LKLVKPIVMGHSRGASSTAWFAAKYPDLARAIVLEDPGLLRRPGTPAAAANAAPPEERRAATLKRNNTSFEELVDGCMKNSPKWGQAECGLWAPSKQRHHLDTALVSIANRPAMKDLFAKITVPTLILRADAEGDLQRENKAQTLEVLNAFLADLPWLDASTAGASEWRWIRRPKY